MSITGTRHWTRLRREGSEGSEGSKGSKGGGGALSGANYKKAAPIPVISTEAKRSGEISPSDGTGGITVGDLST